MTRPTSEERLTAVEAALAEWEADSGEMNIYTLAERIRFALENVNDTVPGPAVATWGAPQGVPTDVPMRCDQCGGTVNAALSEWQIDRRSTIRPRLGLSPGPVEPTAFEATYTGYHVCPVNAAGCPHDVELRYRLTGNPVSLRCRLCDTWWPLGEPVGP